MASRRIPGPIQSIAFIVPFLTLAATVGALANSLRADECLSAPDSPSPQGTHWYYRLDLPTQRKCWYLRAPIRSLRRAAEAVRPTPDECLSAPDAPSPQGTHWYYRLDLATERKCWYLRAPVRSLRRAAEAVRATAVPSGRRHSVDGPPISVDPGETASPSSRVDTIPVDRPTSEGITATGGTLIQQSVPVNFSESPPIGTLVPQANTLSQTGNAADGPPVAPTAWPDPPPTNATVHTQNPIADPINASADWGPIDAAGNAGGNNLTDNAGNYMAAIVAFLALGLAAMCVVTKNLVARREPTIIDHRDPLDSGHDRRRTVDEGQLLVSALSERGPVLSDDVPFETALEIRKRKDKLARLHQYLDRLLQSPTTA